MTQMSVAHSFLCIKARKDLFRIICKIDTKTNHNKIIEKQTEWNERKEWKKDVLNKKQSFVYDFRVGRFLFVGQPTEVNFLTTSNTDLLTSAIQH